MLDENLSWLRPTYIDPVSGQLVLCVQSYVVRTKHHNILIDSCVGNHKERTNYPFWNRMESDRYERNLAATGLTVNDIDYVMCTHMHVDHVGWNTRLENGRWVPTFPKAKYVFADRELAFWTEKERNDPGKQPWIADSVLPIVAAGRQEIVTSHHELSDVVKLIPTPGHTIDHFSVHVGKPGADAVIGGDMIHSPIQARYPELCDARGLRPAAGRRVTAHVVRAVVRYVDAAVHRPLSVAVERAADALGGWVQVQFSLTDWDRAVGRYVSSTRSISICTSRAVTVGRTARPSPGLHDARYPHR